MAIALVAILPALAMAERDGRDNDRPDFRGHDRPDFRELNAQWQQWALSIPASANPLLETTTAGPSNCSTGQRSPVWFLGGIFGGGVASRRCTVPQNVALYFPIINTFQNNSPGVCGQGANDIVTLSDIRRNTAAFIDQATDIVATIDSRPVRTIRRVKSVPFASVFPADNILIAGCNGNNPAGVYSPTADDGYYGYIESLSPGEHILQFSGRVGDFNLNVTYQLTVIPVSLR